MTITNPNTGMRVVRTRSIPAAPTDRLESDLAVLHGILHTAAGLHAFDAPRRSLVDTGKKAGKIRAELAARGVRVAFGCRFCDR